MWDLSWIYGTNFMRFENVSYQLIKKIIMLSVPPDEHTSNPDVESLSAMEFAWFSIFLYSNMNLLKLKIFLITHELWEPN